MPLHMSISLVRQSDYGPAFALPHSWRLEHQLPLLQRRLHYRQSGFIKSSHGARDAKSTRRSSQPSQVHGEKHIGAEGRASNGQSHENVSVAVGHAVPQSHQRCVDWRLRFVGARVLQYISFGVSETASVHPFGRYQVFRK